MIHKLKDELQKLAAPARATVSASVFKTGKGEYGEGDIFIGVTVPDTRKIAKNYLQLELPQITILLESPVHEHRLIALLILVERFKKADDKIKTEIYKFYLKHTKYVNNWDLVDLSAHYIVGSYLFEKDKAMLYKLVKSNNLWERRIAIIATFAFIRKNKFQDTFKIAELLLQDKHDLMHKAVGWMLREVGKKDQRALETFLKQHYKIMPRTMLRYAVERFDEKKRKEYMQKSKSKNA